MARRLAVFLSLGVALNTILLLPSKSAFATPPGANGKIAFEDHGGEDPFIMTVNPDGSNLTFLIDVAASPAWSPDGSTVAYHPSSFGDGIWVVDEDGTNQRQLSSFGDHPAWSPDGDRIAFVSGGIWVMNSDGSGQTRLTTGYDAAPDWSPSGALLAFDRGGDIWLMSSDGSGQTALTSGTASDTHPSWSPDGATVAFAREQILAPLEIWTVNSDGGNVVRLSPDTQDFWDPVWSPQGDQLAVVTWCDHDYQGVSVLTADGSLLEGCYNADGRQVDLPSWQPIATAADLSLDATDSPDPVLTTQQINYSMPIANAGPSSATNVTLNGTVSSDVMVQSISSTQGSCTGATAFTCTIGTLSLGGSVMVTVVVVPVEQGTVSVAGTVTADETDSYLTNNSASESTTVNPAPDTSYVAVTDSGFSPKTTTLVGPGKTVQWNFFGPGPQSATDTTGMGLFDSGSKSPVSYFPFTFTAAGIYPYASSVNPSLTGSVSVPVTFDQTFGWLQTPFQVTWASAPPPPGFVFDVQILRPNSDVYVNWKTNQVATSSTFTADDGIGAYWFQARLRKTSNGTSSNYSKPKAITVGVLVKDTGFNPVSTTARQNTAVNWSFDASNTTNHTASDGSGMGLFDSGAEPPGGRYAFTLTAAGTYKVLDKIGLKTSKLSIPVVASPLSGNQTTVFTITWASVPATGNYVYDAQIKRPAQNWANWKIGQTVPSSTFVADAGSGAYSFRARLRNFQNLKATLWSPVVTITVTLEDSGIVGSTIRLGALTLG